MIKRLKSKLNSDIQLKEILTGSAVTFVLKMSGMLLGYLVVLIISRQYGAEGIGVYHLTISIMTFVAMIAAMGMNVSILRYVGQFNKSGEEYKLKLLYRYAVELVVPFSLLLAVLLYFTSGIIAQNVFHNMLYKSSLEFAAIIVPIMVLKNISVEFIRGLKQLKISEYLRSVNQPLINITLLLIIGLFLFDELLPLYTLGVGIVVSAIYAVYFIVNRLQSIKEETKSDLTKRELVSTSLPMMITSVALFVMGNVSLFMLQVLSTIEDVGVFSVTLKIATLISLSLIVVNTISAPKFSELYWAKKIVELQVVLNHTSKLILISSLVCASVLIIFSEQLLGLFGDEFRVGKSALILLIIWQIVNAAAGSVGVFLNMTGNQKILRNIILLTMFLSVFLNYILIPGYGFYGAAVATMVSGIILNVFCVMYVKIRLDYYTFYVPFLEKYRNEKNLV